MNARGFSLIELMIAVMILTVGVLGVAGSARVVTQMTGSGARYGASAAVASSRFEQLRAADCSTVASGSATTGRFAEKWTVTTAGMLRTVTLTITYNNGTKTRTDVFSTMISCAPSS